MATAMDVAKYVIRTFQAREDLITNLKLQKLLYYVQGWHLGLYGARAFDGQFKAWVHGPVNLDVYHAFKHNRWNPILDEMPDVKLSAELEKHVDDVLEVYGGDTAWSLEQRTHRERPWLEARGTLQPDEECQTVISDRTMQAFFEEQGRDADGEDSKGK
ncbi:Panacea domain-containing protein [Luteibacter sp. NPDC031894]|uniref:Panacea domain-containing protein n=1 Tax=Luteibacter sp. NPDC031894 TaxID=3390572 RepID=UPI003CFC80EB